jgi:urease accessory protein
MTVVTQVLGTVQVLQGQFRHEDALLLSSDERASPHFVGRTVAGRSLRISLPRESELNDGDVPAVEGDVAIVVRAAAEQLFIVRPDDALQWGVAGFQLGNLHRLVRFTDEAMLTPADPMVAEPLTRLKIRYEQRTMPFVGRCYGSFTGHGHGHGHHHEHDHRDS